MNDTLKSTGPSTLCRVILASLNQIIVNTPSIEGKGASLDEMTSHSHSNYL
jgi:hypothetical protein